MKFDQSKCDLKLEINKHIMGINDMANSLNRQKINSDYSVCNDDKTIDIIKAKYNLNTSEEVLNFLLDYYKKTNAITEHKQHKTSPGKMTIKDASKYIGINDYPDSPCGYGRTFADVTITYVKAFTDTAESIDTVTFTCRSIINLEYLWMDFAEGNNLKYDCIRSFNINLTEADNRYARFIDSVVNQIIDATNIDVAGSHTKKPTEEDRKEILGNIFRSSYFFKDFNGKIIYPHISNRKDPKTGIMVRTVERYWED